MLFGWWTIWKVHFENTIIKRVGRIVGQNVVETWKTLRGHGCGNWKRNGNEFEKLNADEKKGEKNWLLIKKSWIELNNYRHIKITLIINNYFHVLTVGL